MDDMRGPSSLSGTSDRSGDVELLADVRSEQQKVERFRKWFDQSRRADEAFRATAIKARKYLSGEQWSDEDLERRRKARRPALVINKILPRVLFLTGMQRAQREEPKFLPFEGGDSRSTDLISALYKFEATVAGESSVDSQVFGNKVVDGLGFWKAGWSFDGDNLEGDLQLERVDPLSIFADPNWHDAGWKNAEYVIHATMFHLEDALEYWPEHEGEIRRKHGEWLRDNSSTGATVLGGGDFAGDSLSSERPYWDPQTQRLRVCEVWYKQRVTVDAVQRTDTNEISTEPERVAYIQQILPQNPELAATFTFLRVPVTRIRVAHWLDDVLLDDQDTPYRDQIFPIFPTRGYYWWRQPFGVVQPLFGLQDEKNVRRSTVTEITQRAALSGWYNHESQGAKTRDLEQYAAGVGKVINHKGQRPEEITPPQLPQSLVYLERMADADIDNVSNINADLLGTSTQRTVSGRAITARQQSAMIVQEPMLDSFRQDKEAVVKFCISLIQQFLSVPKALRILGTIAMRQPDSETGQMMNDMPLMEVQDTLQGAFSAKYDVIITTQPYDASRNRQKLDALMELLPQFGPYVPPDVVVSSLKDAGVLDEEQAQKILAHAQQQLQADQMQQAAATAGQAPAPPKRVA